MYKITVEDLSESWCHLIGLPVRRAIYGILHGSDAFIIENQRGENPLQYDWIRIKSVTTIMYDGKEITLPSLQSCGLEIEREYGKKILFGILDAKEKDFTKIPMRYELLLAITRYWHKYCTVSKKDILLKSFLLNLQQPMMALSTTSSMYRDSTMKSQKPLFPVLSFTHAFAEWQSLYSNIYYLWRLLQEPMTLPPISDFLECSYLHSYVEIVMKEGVKKVIQQNGLKENVYLDFLSATYSAEEPINYW